MIRRVEEKDYNEILHIIESLNKDETFHSSFVPGNIKSLKKELRNTTKNQCGFVYEEDKIKGVIVYFQYNKELPRFDIGGPYYLGNNEIVGEELLAELIQSFKSDFKLNFFFDKRSNYYTNLMKEFNAQFNGYEYILQLDRSVFLLNKKTELMVRTIQPKDHRKVTHIHNASFEDIYFTSDMLLNSKTVYVLEKENKVIGYCLLKEDDVRLYVEVIAIDKAYRNKGYGSFFLQEVIQRGFTSTNKNKVELVVDAINDYAVKVYTKIGFMIKKINASYKIVR